MRSSGAGTSWSGWDRTRAGSPPASAAGRTIGEPVALGGVVVNPGDIVVADDDGVIVIPPHRAEEALTAVEAIVAREADLDAEVTELRSRIA
ncbi:hypothetical protein [Streptomyces phaeochromogenes]|uniref:RraA family protein n=1 Tax=Streptomyces phaeochromogenes TaxID=1923 RepID=UPI00386884EF